MILLLPSSMWAPWNNDFWQIAEEQKKDDSVTGVSWDYHGVISKLAKIKFKDEILWPHSIWTISDFYTPAHIWWIVLWGRIVILSLEALSIRRKIAAHSKLPGWVASLNVFPVVSFYTKSPMKFSIHFQIGISGHPVFNNACELQFL